MQAVKEEIADVFICIHNYANARGINLAEAVSEKLKKIEEKRFDHEQLGTIY
jgi:NTP pyrophosphatase (non-canonical NTP hydrolase)